MVFDSAQKMNFLDFELLSDKQFYISWYENAEVQYSAEIEAIDNCDDLLGFAAEDELEKDKFVLTWQITKAFRPAKTTKPAWLYIHEIVKNGSLEKDGEYPQIAIQLTKDQKKIPPFPFEFSDDLETAFRIAVIEPDIAQHLIQKNKKYILSNSTAGVPKLIKRMCEIINEKKLSDP